MSVTGGQRNLFDLFPEEKDRAPQTCPICGCLISTGLSLRSSMEYLAKGYTIKETKPSHRYRCKNLEIAFCDECISGEGGVDIISKVIEASPTQRATIEQDAAEILKKRHVKFIRSLRNWFIGIGVVIVLLGVSCLIFGLENTGAAVGVIFMLLFIGLIQGRR